MTSTIANSTTARPNTPGHDKEPRLRLRCPACAADVRLQDGSGYRVCISCGFVMVEREGIVRTLVPERQSYFSRFIREYELVRAAEGRGATSSDYYLELPFHDLTDRNSWQWKIRARSYRAFEK